MLACACVWVEGVEGVGGGGVEGVEGVGGGRVSAT